MKQCWILYEQKKKKIPQKKILKKKKKGWSSSFVFDSCVDPCLHWLYHIGKACKIWTEIQNFVPITMKYHPSITTLHIQYNKTEKYFTDALWWFLGSSESEAILCLVTMQDQTKSSPMPFYVKILQCSETNPVKRSLWDGKEAVEQKYWTELWMRSWMSGLPCLKSFKGSYMVL
jgi:hypothetical protein